MNTGTNEDPAALEVPKVRTSTSRTQPHGAPTSPNASSWPADQPASSGCLVQTTRLVQRNRYQHVLSPVKLRE
jgi:hypothetical protein